MHRRLFNMNSFDIEHHLKKTADEIEAHINTNMELLDSGSVIVNEQGFKDLYRDISNDIAEVTRVVSAMSHRKDISQYLKNGQLYREERANK